MEKERGRQENRATGKERKEETSLCMQSHEQSNTIASLIEFFKRLPG